MLSVFVEVLAGVVGVVALASVISLAIVVSAAAKVLMRREDLLKERVQEHHKPAAKSVPDSQPGPEQFAQLRSEIAALRARALKLSQNDTGGSGAAEAEKAGGREPAVSVEMDENDEPVISIDVSGTPQEAARDAVRQSGLSGDDADRLYQGIMRGLAEAQAAGKPSGTIAVNLDPRVILTPLNPIPPTFRPDKGPVS